MTDPIDPIPDRPLGRVEGDTRRCMCCNGEHASVTLRVSTHTIHELEIIAVDTGNRRKWRFSVGDAAQILRMDQIEGPADGKNFASSAPQR